MQKALRSRKNRDQKKEKSKFLQKDQQQGLTKRERQRKLKLLLTQFMTLVLLLYQNLTKKKKGGARNLHINIYHESQNSPPKKSLVK